MLTWRTVRVSILPRFSEPFIQMIYPDSSPKSHLLSYRLKRKEPQQSRPKRSDWVSQILYLVCRVFQLICRPRHVRSLRVKH